MLKTFIFIGRSGSGKGTQARLLKDSLEKSDASTPVFYLETGKLFRKFFDQDTYAARRSKEIINEGGIGDTFVANWLWGNAMIENLQGNEHLILDGAPRNTRQARALDSALYFYNRQDPLPYVFYINISEEEARERMEDRARGADDDDDAISRKLAWFDTEVLPAIEWYRLKDRYKLVEIDGEREIDEIHQDIMKHIN